MMCIFGAPYQSISNIDTCVKLPYYDDTCAMQSNWIMYFGSRLVRFLYLFFCSLRNFLRHMLSTLLCTRARHAILRDGQEHFSCENSCPLFFDVTGMKFILSFLVVRIYFKKLWPCN